MYPYLTQNRLKFYQKLNQKKYRDREALYIISGLRAVKESLSATALAVDTIILAENKLSLIDDLNLKSKPFAIQLVSEKDFTALNDEKTPQGICAVAKKHEMHFSAEKFNDNLLFYFDRINDPGNLGTVIRSAAWFGIKAILLSPESADPYQPKSVRASAGVLASMNIYENVPDSGLQQLKNQGYQLYATDSSEGKDLNRIQPNHRSIVLVGSEAHGLDKNIQALADHKISIPRVGSGESLNLAIAASIIMFQATKPPADNAD